MIRNGINTVSLLLLSLLFACSVAQRQAPAPVAQARPAEKPTPALTATSNAPAPQPIREKLVAKVNGKPLTLGEFDRLYQSYLLQNRKNGSSAQSKQQFLQKLIADSLLQQYAEEQGIEREPQFQRQLESTRSELVVEYFTREKLLRNIQVSNAEIEQYYDSHLEDYSMPEKIQVRFILTSTLDEAEKALERLRNGERFADVARDLSIHSSRVNGGLLEPFARGTYNKPFEEAAFALKVGELSSTIKTDAGFCIMEKTAEIPRQITPLSAVRGKISEILLAEKERTALQNFVARLKSTARIETYPIPE
jgi:peptidyl-prolyl cis-trans isomerase C